MDKIIKWRRLPQRDEALEKPVSEKFIKLMEEAFGFDDRDYWRIREQDIEVLRGMSYACESEQDKDQIQRLMWIAEAEKGIDVYIYED